MDPLTLATLVSSIPAIAQGIFGGFQLSKAKRIEAQYPRPEAEIAPSIDKLTGYAYGQTLAQDIPGGEMYRGEIKGATAAGMRAASELGSGAEAYGMLGQLVGREQGAFGDLAKLTAGRVAGKEDVYMNTLLSKAEEEKRVWDWNKAQPYLRAAQIASQLRESGMQNIFKGGAKAFGAGAEAISPDFNSSILFGKGNTGGAGTYSMEDIMSAIQSLTGK